MPLFRKIVMPATKHPAEIIKTADIGMMNFLLTKMPLTNDRSFISGISKMIGNGIFTGRQTMILRPVGHTFIPTCKIMFKTKTLRLSSCDQPCP